MKKTHGFTLIELLVVVLVIAVLAAIAVPNLLEAQVRSKVARTKSDLRTTAVAVEVYGTDHNAYPPNFQMTLLSTPVAYLSDALVPDLFAHNGSPALGYLQGKATSDPAFLAAFGITGSTDLQRGEVASHWYFLFSNGPDRIDEALRSPVETFRDVVRAPGADLGYFYDPTNGTVSRGDILRTTKFRS